MILTFPSLAPAIPAAVALAATALACAVLARAARRWGWVDRGDGVRKLQREPLPTIGGLAIAFGMLCALWAGAALPASCPDWLVRRVGEALGLAPRGGGYALFVGGACAAAGVLGALDDALPRGLAAAPKLAGQASCALVLVFPLLGAGAGADGDPLALALAALHVAVALAALNACNTFDNADGATATLTALALARPLPWVAAAWVGFLPFNVRRSDGRACFGRGLPRAILGDCGSHAAGMWIAATPIAWPALALPLWDLARVCIERTAAGAAFWVGDRRHLAHRLERAGLPPLAVLASLVAIAAPSLWLGGGGSAGRAFEGAWVGMLATAALGTCAAWATRVRGAGTSPPQGAEVELTLEALDEPRPLRSAPPGPGSRACGAGGQLR